MKDYDNKLWQEAITMFAQLKAKYPYSKYATLAEIRQADVKYGSEHWQEAADAYHAFVQYHPNNEDVPYAMFKEAMSHYQQIDSDIFFLPPTYEKDQAEIGRAEQLFSDYLERYSSDKNRAEGEKYLGECRKNSPITSSTWRASTGTCKNGRGAAALRIRTDALLRCVGRRQRPRLGVRPNCAFGARPNLCQNG